MALPVKAGEFAMSLSSSDDDSGADAIRESQPEELDRAWAAIVPDEPATPAPNDTIVRMMPSVSTTVMLAMQDSGGPPWIKQDCRQNLGYFFFRHPLGVNSIFYKIGPDGNVRAYPPHTWERIVLSDSPLRWCYKKQGSDDRRYCNVHMPSLYHKRAVPQHSPALQAQTSVSLKTCPLCLEKLPGSTFVTVDHCGHNVCLECLARYVKSVISNHGSIEADDVKCNGVRCPALCDAPAIGKCAAVMPMQLIQQIAHESRSSLSADDALSVDDMQKLERLAFEKAVADASVHEKFAHCPSCRALQLGPQDATDCICNYCELRFCMACGVKWHEGVTCKEYQREISHGDGSADTAALVEATTKPCPKCRLPTTHYHGHACHHIQPGRGCRQCGHHWCFACGAEWGSCSCELSCATCIPSQFLVLEPYPHDSRCGCPICPDCRPRSPCALCDGSCVVCHDEIKPGPMSLQTTEQYWQDVMQMKKKHALELLSNALNADAPALENALSVAVNADLTEVELQPARLALQCRCALLLRNLGSASDAGNPGRLRDAIDDASLVTAGTPEGVTCNQAVEHARVRLQTLQESRRKVQSAVDMALSARFSWPKVMDKVVSEAHYLGLSSQALDNATVIHKMCMTQVRVPRNSVAAFIGPKGAHIRKFEVEHGVNVSFVAPSDEEATHQVAYVFLRSGACEQFLKLSPEGLREAEQFHMLEGHTRRSSDGPPGDQGWYQMRTSLLKAESCLVRLTSSSSQSQPIQRDLEARAQVVLKRRSECEPRSSTERVIEPSQRRRAGVDASSHGKRHRCSRSRSHSTSENAKRWPRRDMFLGGSRQPGGSNSDRHQQRRRRARKDDVCGGRSTSRRRSAARDSKRSCGRSRSRRHSSVPASRRTGA